MKRNDDIEIKRVERKSWKGVREFDYYHRSSTEKYSHAQDTELLGRSIKILNLHDKLIINVAGGHGKEAEFLVGKGANVVLGDIAEGQLFSAKIRKEKHGLDNIELILLDAEHLPFNEKSFDFGYVYDGVHHFPNPYQSISELCHVVSNCIVLVDVMNPLITKILTFFGFFRREWCGIEPKRLEERKIRLSLSSQNVTLTSLYVFNPPYYKQYGDYLCATIKLFAFVINFMMSHFANKVFGLLFGNVAIIIVKFEKEDNFGKAS